MSGFSVPWSDAQQERLEDLVADGHDLAAIMRRMPGHPRARLARKIAGITSKPEDANHLADAAATPARPEPAVREHGGAPVTPEIPREERSGTAREAPGTLGGRDGAEPVVGAAPPDVGAQPAAPTQIPSVAAGRAAAGAASTRVSMRIKLSGQAFALLESMAADSGKRPVVLAADLLTAVLEDDAAAHRDSEAA